MSEGAEFFDGRSAARRAVALRFDASGLRIEGDNVSRHWPYADIRHASAATDLPLVLRCRSTAHDDARLIVGDTATIDAMKRRCPDLEGRRERRRGQRRTVLWTALGVAGLGATVLSVVHFLPRLVAPLVPIAWEETLGDRVVADITRIFGVLSRKDVRRCDESAGQAALNGMVGRLTGQIDTPFRFEVIVLDVDMVNALAAPGGRIVVLRKLLSEAKTPDEVAGVIAHEMGHVISRHPTQAMARSMGMSLVFNVLLGGVGSGMTGAVGEALVSSAYSRDAEREADTIGLDILRRARISPKGIAAFFERLAKSEGDSARALGLISSHPPSDERANAARIADPPDVRPALAPAEWTALRGICGNG